jgi:hypothetical protein
MEYLYENYNDSNLLTNSEYLRRNLYSFHLKGSSAFIPLMKLHDSNKKRKYSSDFDSICVMNPYYFTDQKTFGYFRFLLIIGLIQGLVNIVNDDNENYFVEENLKKNGIEIEKMKEGIELIQTGCSIDDLHFETFFNHNEFDESSYKLENIQISEKSLYRIKILTNITNSLTSHMLISVELKTKIPVHIFDIVIPTSMSQSLYYEWLLSQNTQKIEGYKMNYLSKNEEFMLYQVEKICKYYILNLDIFFVDQLYSSHYLMIKNEMNNEKIVKYEKRLKYALYIVRNLFNVGDLYRIIEKYGKIVLPNSIKFLDLLVGVTNLHMICDI